MIDDLTYVAGAILFSSLFFSHVVLRFRMGQVTYRCLRDEPSSRALIFEYLV